MQTWRFSRTLTTTALVWFLSACSGSGGGSVPSPASMSTTVGGSPASSITPTPIPSQVDARGHHGNPTPVPTEGPTGGPSPTPTPSETPVPAPSVIGVQAGSSNAFVNFIGVNTHYFDGGSAYDTPSAEAALENLGVLHLRDQPGESSQDHHYLTLASFGIHLDMFWMGNYQTTRSPSTYAGSTIALSNFDSYEGENEQNVTCSGDGTWVSDVTALQSSLWSGMQSNGLSTLPLIAPSFGNCGSWAQLISDANAMGTGVAAYSTYGNAHAYAGQVPPEQGGYVASQSSNSGIPNSYQGIASIETPGKPLVVTEAGYGSDTSGNDNGVGAVGQERYTLRELLNFWNQGAQKAYVYALLDDPSGGNWGLMTDSYVAKPAYTALKNLISTLSDPGGAGFSPGQLNDTLGGTLTNVNNVLLEKSNGTFELILWQAVASVNAGDSPLTVAPQTVTLTFPSAPSSIGAQTFTNTGTLTPVTLAQSGSVTSVPVTDIPVIVRITPASSTDGVLIKRLPRDHR